MLYSRFGLILATLLVFMSHASYSESISVEDEFTQCASLVLRDRISEATVYHVDLSELDSVTAKKPAMLENRAEKTTFVGLEMELMDGSSGEKIGDVRCYLTDRGQLVGAEFIKIFSTVASNQ